MLTGTKRCLHLSVLIKGVSPYPIERSPSPLSASFVGPVTVLFLARRRRGGGGSVGGIVRLEEKV